MINSLQMMSIIKDTLKGVGSKYCTDDAVILVHRTGLVESKYQYLMQVGGDNIARGFFQCEPWVAVDVCENYLKYRTDLMKRVADACYLDWSYFVDPDEDSWRHILTTNIAAQIILCRLHYRRVPKPLPKTLDDQAQYWKTYYNTSKGSGTVEHFKEIVVKNG